MEPMAAAFSSQFTPEQFEALLKFTPPADLRNTLLEIYELAYHLIIKMRGSVLLYAKQVGDRKELAAYVRAGGSISDEMRQYIATLIEGKAPPRAINRHAALGNAKRNRAIVWFILRARAANGGDDLSTEQACDRFGLGKRYVQEIFREGRDSELELIELTERLLNKLQRLPKD
jgi:hypothetical protein